MCITRSTAKDVRVESHITPSAGEAAKFFEQIVMKKSSNTVKSKSKTKLPQYTHRKSGMHPFQRSKALFEPNTGVFLNESFEEETQTIIARRTKEPESATDQHEDLSDDAQFSDNEESADVEMLNTSTKSLCSPHKAHKQDAQFDTSGIQKVRKNTVQCTEEKAVLFIFYVNIIVDLGGAKFENGQNSYKHLF